MPYVVESTASRDWKKEMIAYLDWSKSKDDRIDAMVDQEIEDNPFGIPR